MKYTNDPRVDTGVDYYLPQSDPLASVHAGIVKFIKDRAGKKVLDFGCGTGGYARKLMNLGLDVTAVDLNHRYVERARALGVQAQVIEEGRLPFPDQSFDTVYLVEVLEHLPDAALPLVLAEIRRVVRSNVLATVPSNNHHEDLFTAGFLHNHFIAVDHVQFFTPANLAQVLKPYFSSVTIAEDDPVWPHRLLPPAIRRAVSLLYRLRLIRPTIYSRLYVEARNNA